MSFQIVHEEQVLIRSSSHFLRQILLDAPVLDPVLALFTYNFPFVSLLNHVLLASSEDNKQDRSFRSLTKVRKEEFDTGTTL